jgi:DNA mismatch repair protein MutS
LILDEIGRGTSTFDGMSIAKAVLEYVANPQTLGAKTLFATHYHELTSMVDEYSNMKNYSIAVKKNGDDITFLRRIIPSAADESYGIEVAKLAGIPNCVISRAKEILKNIENDKSKINFENTGKEKNENAVQLELKEPCLAENEIVEKLKKLDVSVLTPIESMNILYGLIKLADEV